MTGFVTTTAGVQEVLHPGFAHPGQDLEFRLSLKPLIKEQEKSVRKKEDDEQY